MGKRIFVFLMAISMLFMTCGCSEATTVNMNMNKQADYFDCERRITVYNALTDKVILGVEGYMSISNNAANELVVTCKVGPEEYKRNYVYLNDFTLYAVEDITGTHSDGYHYNMYVNLTQPTVDDLSNDGIGGGGRK